MDIKPDRLDVAVDVKEQPQLPGQEQGYIPEFHMTHAQLVKFLTEKGINNINHIPSRMGDPLLDRETPKQV